MKIKVLIVVILYIILSGNVFCNDTSKTITENNFRTPLRKAPYIIYSDVQSEMNILWQTDSIAVCSIEWGLDTLYTLGNTEVLEYGEDHQYRQVITELLSNTKYYYRVHSNEEIYSGTFLSAPSSESSELKFIAYGDCRSQPEIHDEIAEKVIAAFTEDNAFQTFVLSSGDLVYDGNIEEEWDEFFFNSSYLNISTVLANMSFLSTIGNHDGTGELFMKYFPYPYYSDRYWSFNYGPGHFIMLDQYTDYSTGSEQLIWLENELMNSTKAWKFISIHEPGFSTGRHGNNIDVQNYIQPLCEQYGVSIVFSGHNHLYARALVNNVLHITPGGAGASLYEPDLNDPYIITAAMEHHFCKIEIIDNILNFTAVNIEGEVIDSFIFNVIPKPENVIISASNNNITISWSEVENADSYSIYSSSDPNVPFEDWLLEESGIQDTSWTDISANPLRVCKLSNFKKCLLTSTSPFNLASIFCFKIKRLYLSIRSLIGSNPLKSSSVSVSS